MRALGQALKREGITAEVYAGYELACAFIDTNLIVRCDGHRSWWRTMWNDRNHRAIYAWHPAIDPLRAARRVARQYALARIRPRGRVR
ncbi:hypothetical protein [Nonomuraea sp. NPDC050540]|uniref:hypothetical protein n=1 Tax=Nonomuraea sp. NPDC050540 TaxID=3364367 RepID=UPI0037B8CF9C